MRKTIRTIHNKKDLAKQLFDSLKLNIVAHNKHLADKVETMTTKQLLNNAHPLDRDYFQSKITLYNLENA